MKIISGSRTCIRSALELYHEHPSNSHTKNLRLFASYIDLQSDLGNSILHEKWEIVFHDLGRALHWILVCSDVAAS